MDRWDARFLEEAKNIAQWSKDPSTKTGALLVSPNRKVVIGGYNGFPHGMSDANELYENREEKYSRIVHCEMNALINAQRNVEGFTLYTWPFASCDRCAVHMIQAGITRVVAPPLPEDLVERWGANLKRSIGYFQEAGVEVCIEGN